MGGLLTFHHHWLMVGCLLYTMGCNPCTAKVKPYRNWHVFTVGPLQNTEQVDAMKDFIEDYDGNDNVNMLTDIASLREKIEIAVSPYELSHVTSYLKTCSIPYTQISADLYKSLQQEKEENTAAREHLRKRRSVDDNMVELPHYYMLYDQMNEYMERIVNASRGRAEMFYIGDSYEGRSMFGVKVNNGTNRPKLWIDAGIHAREWIAPATALHMLHQLVFNDSEAVRTIADAYQWYILPLANPDGYHFTWTDDRLWRKNRHPNGPCPDPCKTGIGVDLNRNFNFNWGRHTNRNPCSMIFPGTSPFSEPESRNMRNFITKIKHSMHVYFSLHSFMQLWVVPWAGLQRRSPDYPELVGHSGKNPCSTSFHGRAPFSEVESRNMKNYIMAERHGMHVYFSLHAFLQFFILPWVGERYRAADYPELERVANISSRAMFDVHGEEYQVVNFPEKLYLASGSSMDWVKATAGVKYAYTIELRPSSRQPHFAVSFQLQPSQIRPTGEEVLAGVLSTASLVLKRLEEVGENGL